MKKNSDLRDNNLVNDNIKNQVNCNNNKVIIINN